MLLYRILFPHLLSVEDSDSIWRRSIYFCSGIDSIPPDSISLLEYESLHFDFPSSPSPPEKPPDDDVYFDIEPDTGV
ncbi:hypothetical protein Tco_1160455 [Tanacetum coccineum]